MCPVSGQAGKSVTTRELLTSCYKFPALVILADATTWGMRWAKKPGAGESSSSKCDDMPSGTSGGHVTFPPGQDPLVNPPGGFGSWQPDYMIVGQAVRYRINPGADGVPNLERSAAGGQVDPDGKSTWEILARGVEDLQVEFENGSGWHSEPGATSCAFSCAAPTQADHDTIIRRVRIRLSARTTSGGQLAGESTSSVGNAVRGQVSTEVAPRTALATLHIHGGEL